MATPCRCLITCEHGGKRIPIPYREFFRGQQEALASHRGYDAGALTLARELAGALKAPLLAATISRLLVDLNRSMGHPRLHSPAIRQAAATVRKEILARYYLPYRSRAEADVAQAAASGRRLIHISCHSFTPQLDGVVRNADIGLLYDPARLAEAGLCRRWQQTLGIRAPALRIRRNYPYAGTADGLTAHLRRRFPAEAYLGIELEINQQQVYAGGRRWKSLRALVIEALLEALASG